MPENTICVTRGTKWGNPWKIGAKLLCLSGKEASQEIIIDRKRAVRMFRNMLGGKSPAAIVCRANIKVKLKGKNLACWCKVGDPCHADVLLEIANK